jgi:hypothetical protein
MIKLDVDGTTLYVRILPEWHPAAALTLGRNVFVKQRYIGTAEGQTVLRHEAVHVRDQLRWSFLWWLSYVLVLPIGPSFKAYWEWRAYRVTLLAELERTGTISPWLVGTVVHWLSGPLYFWACPRSVARWMVEREARRLLAARAAAPSPGPAQAPP